MKTIRLSSFAGDSFSIPIQYPVLCAWCGRIKGYGPIANSHGICASCAGTWKAIWSPGNSNLVDSPLRPFATLTPEEHAEYQAYLDRLETPNS